LTEKPSQAALDVPQIELAESDAGLAPASGEEPVIDIDLDAEAAQTKAHEQAEAGEQRAAAEEPAEAVARAATDPELEAAIVQAEQQMQEGIRIKGYNTIKRLACKHPKHPGALEAYSRAAVGMRAWGEAYRVAYNWVEVEPSAEARLQLAKMERATSRGNYRNTLKKLLAEHPDHAEARALYGGGDKALAQRAD